MYPLDKEFFGAVLIVLVMCVASFVAGVKVTLLSEPTPVKPKLVEPQVVVAKMVKIQDDEGNVLYIQANGVVMNKAGKKRDLFKHGEIGEVK